MSHYIRPSPSQRPVFFTVNLTDRSSDLLIQEISLLRTCVAAVLNQHPFEIVAWVVLPDHMHAVWRLPQDDPDYAKRWAAIKATFSRHLPPGHRRASHFARREKAIWQRRFWEHHIRDAASLRRHIDYCWYNPVKHGLVANPLDWSFSSIHRDHALGRIPAQWAPPKFVGDFGEAA